MARKILEKEPVVLPKETILGALIQYISDNNHTSFQPINSNWALVPPIELPKKERKNKKLKNELLSRRSIQVLEEFVKNCKED